MASSTMTFCVACSTIVLDGQRNQVRPRHSLADLQCQREACAPAGLNCGTKHMLNCVLADERIQREACVPPGLGWGTNCMLNCMLANQRHQREACVPSSLSCRASCLLANQRNVVTDAHNKKQ